MKLSPHQMCFGLNLELDRESIACFLRLLGRADMADFLAARLSSTEIEQLVYTVTGLLKKHMTEDEYHELFLLENSPHRNREQ